jgi:hypothetical protein
MAPHPSEGPGPRQHPGLGCTFKENARKESPTPKLLPRPTNHVHYGKGSRAPRAAPAKPAHAPTLGDRLKGLFIGAPATGPSADPHEEKEAEEESAEGEEVEAEAGATGAAGAAGTPAQPKGDLMIVPFPNPGRATVFGLVDASQTKRFRTAVKEAIPQPRSRAALSSPGASRSAPAAVHIVGNYQCSVVPDLEALRDTIDWTRFKQPADWEARLSVLEDRSVIPEASVRADVRGCACPWLWAGGGGREVRVRYSLVLSLDPHAAPSPLM